MSMRTEISAQMLNNWLSTMYFIDILQHQNTFREESRSFLASSFGAIFCPGMPPISPTKVCNLNYSKGETPGPRTPTYG